MTATRRAVLWTLVAVLCAVLAVMATDDQAELDTTPTTWFSGPGDLTEVHP